ncbi:MAG TPA: PH domain-containing protein [Gaiellaceae bacterium]
MRPRRDEEIYLDARLHGVVLARPIARSAMLVLLGVVAMLVPFAPAAVVGALLIAAGAIFMLRAAWQWERTRLVVTTEKIYLLRGTFHRRAKAVRLRAVDAVEVDQSLVGQLLGYGTVVVGPLKVGHIAHPGDVCRLVERLAS